MSTILTLEVLQAKHGDSLLLYYGNADAPNVIVIDGGPSGVYTSSLRPRLSEVKSAISPDAALEFSLVMVSHLDDDHVNGILQMTEEMVDNKQNHLPPEFKLNNIWVNTFDDIIGNIQIPAISNIPTSTSAASLTTIPQIANAEPHIAAVVASTGQGRQLRDNARLLSATVNNPFQPIENGKATLVCSDSNTPIIDWDGGLKLTVIHPSKVRLLELQKQWDKDLKEAKNKGDNSIIITSITNPDTSPFNLSSIVCLVEFNNKSILLTGDARGDDIMEGLKAANMLNNPTFHVDILKLPHHGSIRNIDAEFFKVVTADHYVISANGKYNNPDKELLNIFSEVVQGGTLHLTNHTGQNSLQNKLDEFDNKMKESRKAVNIEFREPNPSIVINLLDAIAF